MANPSIVVDFVANTKDLAAGFREASGHASGFGAKIKSAAIPATAALTAIGVASKKAVGAASDLNEQISASQQVFGANAKGLQAWAKTGAQAFGLSTTESLRAANAYGNMFNTVGLGSKDVTRMSKQMVQLAGDMASFHDQDPSEMLDKLRSGLSGEAEPLRQFGVLISDAAVKQKAYQEGIAKRGATLTEAQKVQARYALILDQTSKAQGDFARTGDSVANQQRTLAAENQNAAASFGQVLLPVTQAFMRILQQVFGVVGQYRTALQVTIGVVAALAATVLAVNAAVSAWTALTVVARAATLAWQAAQWLLNAALLANPIGLVVIAVAALVAAFVVAYKTSDTFRKIVDDAFAAVLAAAEAVFNWLKSNWPLLLAIIAGPVATAVYLVVRYWDQIKNATNAAWAFVKGVSTAAWQAVWQTVNHYVSVAADAVAGAWNAVRSVTTAAWNAVDTAVDKVVASVKSAIAGLATWVSGWASGTFAPIVHRVGAMFDTVADGARDALASVQRNLNGIVNAIESIVGRVGAAAASVANAIKHPINAVLSAWNGISLTIPRINIPKIKIGKKTIGGGGFGGQTIAFPNVPLLAAGAVIDAPTLAVVGEGAGREIVTPENLLRQIVGEQQPQVQVRVFIGATELTELVRTEIVDANTGLARALLAG